jgi:hypothetical protein
VSKAPASRRGERDTGAEGRHQRRTSPDMEVIVGLVLGFPSTERVECRPGEALYYTVIAVTLVTHLHLCGFIVTVLS